MSAAPDTTAPHGTLVFAAPLTNPFGISDTGQIASIAFADIDHDGDLDAYSGRYYQGKVLLYLNNGTATSPAFGPEIIDPYGLGLASSNANAYSSPALVDIDNDGDLDAFLGLAFDNILYFQNTGTASAPVFPFDAPVSNPFGLAYVGDYATPTFADIDGDGDMDAFFGTGDGNTKMFLNTGTAGSPSFSAAQNNPYGLVNVGGGGKSNPAFADFDHDGDLDAFIGRSDGNTQVFVNTGTATAPVFAAPVTNGSGLSGVGQQASPSFADIDGDGDLDAFIGNFSGDTEVFLNTGTFVAPVTTPTANGTYHAGSVITLSIAFSETVIVNVAGGTPTLALETGTIDRVATYSSGSGTGTLNFTYTVMPGDKAADLDFSSASALTLNGGTIRDGAGNNAILTLAAPGAYGSLGANAALVIDTSATATVATAALSNTGSVNVQSTDTGTAYLVKTSVHVTDLASITGAADGDWNQVPIATANSNTALTLAGLADGSYKLYAVNSFGDLSAPSSGTVTIDGTGPQGPLLFASPIINNYGLGGTGNAVKLTFVDIDHDGDLDAFAGKYPGYTQFYLNEGTASAPSFLATSFNPFGLTTTDYQSGPSFADIDNDGDLDAFIGGRYGDTQYFLNSGTASAPAFDAPTANPFGLANVGYYASPAFADIDGDGDLDAFVGDGAGDTLFFENTGTASAPVFAAPSTNPFGLEDVGSYAAPTFGDFDGDGDLDALVGYGGGATELFVNTGTASHAVFAAPITNAYGLGSVGYNASPAFADLDGDGDLDVYVGSFNGNITEFRSTGGSILPVASNTPDGSYRAGSVISITVTFSENVIVDTTGGAPRLELETGATDRFATYSGGSGTSTLTFTYTVQAGDASGDLDVTSSTAFQLNGATIQDAAGNNALLTLAEPGTDFSLGHEASLVIDNVAPGATLEAGTLSGNDYAHVQSTEVGTAYLVASSVVVTDLASITSAADADWNETSIYAANYDLYLSTSGLGEGSYKLYATDAAGNLSAASAASVTIDNTGPAATLTSASINNSASVTVQSTDTGTAYLVSADIAVSDLSSILGADGAKWNAVAITAANTDTHLAATGLVDGTYLLYTADAAGNLSAVASGSVTLDSTAPTAGVPRVPGFSSPVDNAFGLGDVPSLASPTFADIDHDGDLDAFVSDFYGNTHFFLNDGSTTSPHFAADWTNPFGLTGVGNYGSTPSFADIDGDGDLDAFVGEAYGNTVFFLNSGTAGAPNFEPGVGNPFGLQGVFYNTSETFADIDNDGDLDAFLGAYGGGISFFLNQGTTSLPSFQYVGNNPFGISLGAYYEAPTFADIDGDGDLDLFIGIGYGDTYLLLNTGTATDAAFAAPVSSPYGLTGVGSHAKPVIVDINGDGQLDAFVGAQNGHTYFFLNASTFTAPLVSVSADGAYTAGDVITLSVNFSENVTVDISHGVPTLRLETGAIDRTAVYVSGSGTNTLTFAYTVAASDDTNDLDVTGTSALALNGATIRDAAGNNAVLTLLAPGADGSLGDTASIVVHTAPTATLTPATLSATGFANVRSTEKGTAYLVKTTVAVTDLASITSANGSSWNKVAIGAANADTPLATTGLTAGEYKLYTVDGGGNLSSASIDSVVIDNHAPTATLTTATLGGSGSATARSNEPGTAYLVDSSVVVTNLASITGAADASWNSVAITAANTGTALPVAGLADGSYKLYTTDAAGNLSAASAGSVTVDGTEPTATLTPASIASTGSVTVRSTEPGTAYLVKTSVAVTSVASITASPNSSWNKVAITTADSDTVLSASGLADGSYQLFTADAAGNLSASSTDFVVIDNRAPLAILTAATVSSNGSAAVRSTEVGNAYLVNTSVAVTSLASITAAADSNWNTVPITATNTGTALSAAGLVEGTYKLYTADAAGNLSAASANSVTVDNTGPTAVLLAATIANTGSVTVKSSEAGSAYLVNTSVVVTSLASITGAANASWNKVAIASADTDTALSAAGLAGGTYKLYTTDVAGNLSAASTGSVVIDSTAPAATLASAALDNTGSAVVRSSETGNAYLVDASVTVTSLASITGAADASWNTTPIASAGTDTSLSLAGLADGSYKLYTTDAAGNLSRASGGTVVINNTPGLNLTGTTGAETLTGGAGPDSLAGLGGNDTLVGLGGNDRLNGGGGADTFVFGSASGNDTVVDFAVAQGDRIQVAADINGLSLASGADVLALATDTSTGAVVQLGAGYTIKLVGVSVSELHATDFIVV
ncbi:FG-GAP-like repeat-containing protein [Caenimonas aquaedulcis]|uniref:VCBS repeat-containing protein n=1 Tax=Caenimonas aquaedulcis TaxID=2793270 RepID=A0A931H0W9_9BURK|nr:FG-GAP-like repeat-containing protein [Caenimonas aquaedulcis]MBG9386530.1 VCBS repeat-containing protein [Caenimonas aquaedulcis]